MENERISLKSNRVYEILQESTAICCGDWKTLREWRRTMISGPRISCRPTLRMNAKFHDVKMSVVLGAMSTWNGGHFYTRLVNRAAF